MHLNCRCIKNKWVFKIKCNGVYLVGFVVCGYSQIHVSENYFPVVKDIILSQLNYNDNPFQLLAKIVDVEMAFLYAQGMSNVKKDDCVILNKSIYSLVQAAWQYYKKAVEI